MATTNYTANLHLSAWADTDRPKRADFVSDNSIIDRELGGHLADSTVHVTAEEKAKLSEPYIVSVYAGNGDAERTISLGFAPKFVVVFKRGVPPMSYSGSVMTVNSAYACYGHGTSAGVSVTSTGVIVTESAANTQGYKVSLNASGSQYTVVAFK